MSKYSAIRGWKVRGWNIRWSLGRAGRWFLLSLVVASCRSSRSSTGGDGSGSITAAWQPPTLLIDGQNQDWGKPLPYTIKSEELSYSVTNDGHRLYILMSTKSPGEQQKIIQGGMTVWVNGKANENTSDAVGIGYPLDLGSNRERNLMAEARPDRYKRKEITIEDQREYALYGFSKDSTIQNYTYGDQNPAQVFMRMDFNNAGELIYEASIPLAAVYPKNTSGNYSGKSVAVGFEFNGLPPGAQAPREGGGGGPAIGIGGGLGFGTFGSGGGIGLSIGTGSMIGGGGGRRKALYRPSQVWQTVELARPDARAF